MDFDFTEEQDEIRGLAGRIFAERAAPERIREVEASGEGMDRRLWSELAAAGLLGLAAPESAGGAGLGFLETCVVLEEAGRAAAPVPLGAVLVTGIAPLARHAGAGPAGRWLAPAVAGEALVTGALVEPGGDPLRPTTAAERRGDAWVLTGAKTNVPAGTLADALVVSADTGDGAGLFLVEAGGAGVTRRRQDTTTGNPEAEVDLDGAAGTPLVTGPAGVEALVSLTEHAAAALCVEVAGACQAALKLTAAYTAERRQFDKVIATFQAVGQRAADAYIDAEAVGLTARQAAWRISAGLPADEHVAIAKFWAAEGGQRVVHAAQHIHGGLGVDRSYPLHRYFLAAKQMELTLGGATPNLLRLGALMAEETV